MHFYPAPLSQCFAEQPLASGTGASLFGYVSTGFAHIETTFFFLCKIAQAQFDQMKG